MLAEERDSSSQLLNIRILVPVKEHDLTFHFRVSLKFP